MASAAQVRAQNALKAFVKKHGRAPRKGESTMSGRAATSKRSRSTAQSQAPRKKRRKPAPFHVKAWRWVKKNPVKSTVAVAALGIAAVPASRNFVVEQAKTGYAATTALLR